jgi:hypothetical protein
MSVNLGHVAAMGTPAQGGFTVTPSDSVDFDLVARGLYVSVAVVTFPAVPAGAILPIVCTRVNDTGTDASLGIVGLY